jgi:signal transduction histidine kinase
LVSATADQLSFRKGDPELVKMSNRLRATTTRMAQLIDDVLDFSRGRLGSGIGVTLERISDLSRLLHVVVDELSESNPTFPINCNIAVGGSVDCDSARIQQLLSNLLGNAISHGAIDQPITVDVYVDADHLVVAVTNAGDLIAPETLTKVFEPYWRASNSKPGGGLGLGLYICKQIVRAHDGILEVRSSADLGTRFTARLPVSR